MRKFFCDICHKPFPENTGAPPVAISAQKACPTVQDICQNCFKVGRTIDVEKLVMKEWLRLVQEQGDNSES